MTMMPGPLCGLRIPNRSAKPRTTGMTAINDTGISIGELTNILGDYAEFLDIAKLGVGTAAVSPRLEEKIALYASHKIQVYFGGTLFEKFYAQGLLSNYLEMLQRYAVPWIEVSAGSIDIPLQDRAAIVRDLCSDFTVLGEVGCKDADRIMPPSEWLNELATLLDAGCTYVITEGRDSGTAGIYRASGELRTGLIADLVKSLPMDRIIFEAPKTDAQMFFIRHYGPDVNFGNVSPRDLLLLETQRLGLRCETFSLGNA